MGAATRPSAVYLIVGGLSWPVLRWLYRLQVTGVEHLPKTGGYVLSANHTSSFDPWPLGVPVFPHRFLRFMAKSELFWFPLSSLLLAGGAFKVRRGGSDRAAMSTAVELARAGHVIAMFPEGTRRQKGLRKRHSAQAHTGAARIALEAGVPLVPAGIKGTDGLARLHALSVRYGPPIPLDDLGDTDLREASRVATDRLMQAIGELEASL